MKNYKKHSFTSQIKRRIRILLAAVVLMLIYMVVIGELGLGDSRIMTPLAQMVSRILYFGGLIVIISRICLNRRLLKNRLLACGTATRTAGRAQAISPR